MSNNLNLTDDQIKELVLSSNGDGCAMMRLANHLKLPTTSMRLAGEMVGWSWDKISGVMDGWDITSGKPALHLHYMPHMCDSDDYRSGVAIGRYCFNRINQCREWTDYVVY